MSRQNCGNRTAGRKPEQKTEQKPEQKTGHKTVQREEKKTNREAAGPQMRAGRDAARGREKLRKKGKERGAQAKARRTALCGMMIALAFLLSYVETLIPINFGIPGVKLGLANLVTIVGLYLVELPQLIFISLVRIVLAGFTFGNGFSMVYGLAGGALSLLAMLAARRTGWFSQAGVSIAGGVGHNVGQLIVAALVVENTAVFYYLPVLLAAGSAAGAVIGLLGGIVTGRIQRAAGSV